MSIYPNFWNKSIPENDIDATLDQITNNKDYCFAIYQKIHEHIDRCLSTSAYSALLNLLSFFETPDSYPQFHQSAATLKVYTILNFLKLELKYSVTPFVSTTHNFDELIQQYTLTIFALRRLELELSPDSIAQAQNYLCSIPVNIFNAQIMIANELFENQERLYWNLYQCMKDTWTISNNIYWLTALLDITQKDYILLELSSLYMELHEYHTAYTYLEKLKIHSPEVQYIESILKEYNSNESI